MTLLAPYTLHANSLHYSFSKLAYNLHLSLHQEGYPWTAPTFHRASIWCHTYTSWRLLTLYLLWLRCKASQCPSLAPITLPAATDSDQSPFFWPPPGTPCLKLLQPQFPVPLPYSNHQHHSAWQRHTCSKKRPIRLHCTPDSRIVVFVQVICLPRHACPMVSEGNAALVSQRYRTPVFSPFLFARSQVYVLVLLQTFVPNP